jgi:hypothetical protein
MYTHINMQTRLHTSIHTRTHMHARACKLVPPEKSSGFWPSQDQTLQWTASILERQTPGPLVAPLSPKQHENRVWAESWKALHKIGSCLEMTHGDVYSLEDVGKLCSAKDKRSILTKGQDNGKSLPPSSLSKTCWL